MAKQTILVTGASGYVGGRLIPVLLDHSHQVRASFTDPGKAEKYYWADRCDVVAMDATDHDAVSQAVAGVNTVYYLVHSMAGKDFAAKDRQAAHIMADCCQTAGVQRIIYLSGIIPPDEELSEHLSSRLEVELILTASRVNTYSLRAAVVMGAGSTSFEIIRQISHRLPIQTLPTWMDSLVQPIAINDVLTALVAAVELDYPSRYFDLGGPEKLAYAELLQRYADIAGITRPQVEIPGLPTALVSKLAGLITDVPDDTVAALIESLHHNMVAANDDFQRDLLPTGYQLITVDDSIRRALKQVDPSIPLALRDPLSVMPHDPAWAAKP